MENKSFNIPINLSTPSYSFFLINNNFIEETEYTRRVQGERIQIAQSTQRTEIYKFN